MLALDAAEFHSNELSLSLVICHWSLVKIAVMPNRSMQMTNDQ
jgi:hypothetical protein